MSAEGKPEKKKTFLGRVSAAARSRGSITGKAPGGSSPEVSSPRSKKLTGFNSDGGSARGFARAVSTSMPKMKGFRRHKTETATRSVVLDVGEPILESVSRIWERDLSDLPVAKDLPRLCRRTKMYGKEEVQIFDGFESGDGEISTKTILKKFLLSLGSRLILDISELQKYEKQLEGVTYAETEDDAVVAVKLLEVVERFSTPVLNVVKAIHQDIVLHATVELKTRLTSKYLTKDVRSSDGWRVVVRMPSEGVVHIYHVKKEQSLDSGGDISNHYEFEWELRMTFDGSMREMASAQIRVMNLFMSETIDKKLEEDLKRTLVGDMLVM